MEINCLHFDCLDSTNTWSKENYKQFDPTRLTLVTANQQTAARGRYKRTWLAPAGQNIYASFTFFVRKEFPFITNSAQLMALSAAKVLEELGFNPRLKWPNDILINKKKMSGLLCETILDDQVWAVVVGIGININMPNELLEQIGQPATSLLVESGHMFDVQQILQKLQKQFSQDLNPFFREGFFPFLESYKKYLLHKKGDVLIIDHQKVIFQCMDNDGALVVLQEGVEKKFYAGDLL
jgi:BirA family transcriptional regulator, biotin operon repressor / biotin---[acetyl-CoA-carboxylase] ligase